MITVCVAIGFTQNVYSMARHYATSQKVVGTRTGEVNDVRFEVFTAVTMKNAVFWDEMLCHSCKNRSFGRTYHLYHQGDDGGDTVL
jgi:hypothetical protein